MLSSLLYKFTALFLTLFVFVPAKLPETYSVDKEAQLTAVVVSDTHMEGNNFDRFKNLSKTFKGLASSETKPDALVFCGDNTMNGQNIEWLLFYGFLQRVGLTKSTNVIVAQGNHDFGNCSDADTYNKLSKRAISRYNTFTGRKTEKTAYSTEIKGFRIIALSSDKNMENTVSFISGEQVEFLRTELNNAMGKPVIVVNHNPLKGTNKPQSDYYFNNTVNNEKVREAMEEYIGHVFFFSGHTHYAVSSNTVTTQKNVTYINLPQLAEGAYAPANDECDDAGIGCRISFYPTGAQLSFINFQTGKPVKDFEQITVEF